MKEKLEVLKAKVLSNKKTVAVGTALGTILAGTPIFATESSSGTLINTSGVDLMQVLDEIVALVPVVLPVIVGCLAFRKGFAFLKSAIKGA